MAKDRSLTLHFMDGTNISFEFPEQAKNEAARQIMLEEILKNQYVMVEADGILMLFPVVNIKSIQVMVPPAAARTPISIKGVIRGAMVVS